MASKIVFLFFVIMAVFFVTTTYGAAPICNGPNEHAGCGKPCDVECRYLYEENPECKTNSPKCTERCYCDEDYARERGICVPINKC